MSDGEDMAEIVAEFLVESQENLDELDHSLLELEQDPANRQILSSIFRTVHTIKGTSGFLGFQKLQGLTHAAESLLSGLRDGGLGLTPASASALFAAVDAVRSMLASVEADGSDGTNDYAALTAELGRLQDPGARPRAGAAPAVPAGGRGPAGPGEHVVPAGRPVPDDRPVVEVITHDVLEPAGPAERGPRERWDDAAADPGGAASTTTIRVDVTQLDKLMNLVGELVLARNQILQCTSQADAAFAATAQRLNLITSELQEGVMRARMQPIGTVWSKFPRVVRDLALSCGKQVRLEMEGRETELDKTLIEAIKDPLTHLVRNAVDHGIEAPECRAAAGKAREGRLFLRAYHESGRVIIEIADDGSGIDTERVRGEALAKGLVRPEAAEAMAERELTGLIFLPGFSTAATITNVSGRGVGMDVVKTNIEGVGGSVDVSSEAGRGTVFRITIPLTLAVIPALIVAAAGDRYAIPQVSLVELLRLKGVGAEGIEMVHGVPVHRLRGKLLPLVNLAAELGLREASAEIGGERAANIVVVQAAGRQFGLVVDEISGTEEIVVKPLSQQLRQGGTFAGAAIMGDGRVALILDVVGVVRRAAVMSGLHERANEGEEQPEPEAEAEVEDTMAEALLIVGVGDSRRMAVSLSAVDRLEEFDPAAVEVAGDLEVVHYRGSLLPLLRVGTPAPDTGGGRAPLQVVVHSDGQRTIGLVVDRILDIVQERVVLHREGAAPGVLGSAIIQGHATDVVDLPALTSGVRSSGERLPEVA